LPTRAGASPATVQAVENAVQLGQNIAGIGTLVGAAHVGTSLPRAIVLPSASGILPTTAVDEAAGGTISVYRKMSDAERRR